MATQLTPAIEAPQTALAVSGDVPGPPDPAELVPWLVCEVAAQIPVARFTVRDLLNLRKDSIVETSCHHTRDIPLRVNGQLLCWTEFEVVGNHIGVRVTESA